MRSCARVLLVGLGSVHSELFIGGASMFMTLLMCFFWLYVCTIVECIVFMFCLISVSLTVKGSVSMLIV